MRLVLFVSVQFLCGAAMAQTQYDKFVRPMPPLYQVQPNSSATQPPPPSYEQPAPRIIVTPDMRQQGTIDHGLGSRPMSNGTIDYGLGSPRR